MQKILLKWTLKILKAVQRFEMAMYDLFVTIEYVFTGIVIRALFQSVNHGGWKSNSFMPSGNDPFRFHLCMWIIGLMKKHTSAASSSDPSDEHKELFGVFFFTNAPGGPDHRRPCYRHMRFHVWWSDGEKHRNITFDEQTTECSIKASWTWPIDLHRARVWNKIETVEA